MIDKPQMVDTAHSYTEDDVSEYSYDQAATGKLTGHGGKPLVAHVKITTAYTGAATGVRIFVVDSDSADLSSDRAIAMFPSGSCDDDGIIPTTDIDAIGDHLQCVVPPGIELKRYLGIHVVPANEALATGAQDGWFDDQMEPPNQ